jgi:hypothetical protein
MNSKNGILKHERKLAASIEEYLGGDIKTPLFSSSS